MSLNRRKTLALLGAGIATGLTGTPSLQSAHHNNIKAIAFDGFPILDPRPVFKLAGQLYPEKGREFSNIFRTRLFEYQWLRALAGQYKDFYSIIDDAHSFTASQLNLDLTSENKKQFREAFLNLKAWPDVASSLEKLRRKDIKIAFLSNMTSEMLNAGLRNSNLKDMFDFVISTDQKKTFKPAPRAYQLGVDAFNIPREQIMFAAFAGWDVAGARWFGYPTAWINRLNFKPEFLNARPVMVGKDLSKLVNHLK